MIKAEWTNNDALSAEQVTQTNAPNTLNALDCISRRAAIDALWKALYEYEDKTEKQFQESEELDVADWFQHRIFVQNMNDIDRQTILNLPSAQPELDEWCTDCKEYDQERHCCPRWNRVIRNALKDAHPEPRWIPVEERLPEDERYVLVTTASGDVTEAKYWQKEGFWVLKGLAIMSVTAWMSLPKPYERSEE